MPVRSGSKSIPNKNIKLLLNKPLLYWGLNAANDCGLIDEIHLASDSSKINQIAISFNLNKLNIFNRSQENSQDTSSTESVMLEFLNAKNFNDDDLLILIQATSPFTTSSHLSEAINRLQNSDADSLLSAVNSKRFYWDYNGNAINYDFKNRPRRQDFKGYLMENGAFYINSVKNIKQYHNRLSGKIEVFEMPEYTGLELDEPVDWVIAETLMKNYVK